MVRFQYFGTRASDKDLVLLLTSKDIFITDMRELESCSKLPEAKYKGDKLTRASRGGPY